MIISEQEKNRIRRLHEQSGFVEKQGDSSRLSRFARRQEIEDLGGMTSDPSGIDRDEEIYANFKNQMSTKEINRDEIIKILNQIHTLQHEDAPAIAQRRLEELFEKVGITGATPGEIAGVDFSDDLRRLEEL